MLPRSAVEACIPNVGSSKAWSLAVVDMEGVMWHLVLKSWCVFDSRAGDSARLRLGWAGAPPDADQGA